MVGVGEPLYITIPILIGWMLSFLYFVAPGVPSLKSVYIAGTVLSAFGAVTTMLLPYLPGRPTTAPARALTWFMFGQPLIHFTFAIFIIICIACIYFSCRSYKEFGAKVREKPIYTDSQSVAIATLLAIIMWGTTTQGLESEFGIAQPTLLLLLVTAWIMLLLYTKRIRPAFVMGIIVLVILVVGISATHGLREQVGVFPRLADIPPFFDLTVAQYYSLFSIFYLTSVVCIYFSYRSYRELR